MASENEQSLRVSCSRGYDGIAKLSVAVRGFGIDLFYHSQKKIVVVPISLQLVSDLLFCQFTKGRDAALAMRTRDPMQSKDDVEIFVNHADVDI